MRDASPEAIREALGHIPPDLPRDEWAKVAMALKSELGDAGAELFDEWSARGANYDKRAARDTWRSVKAAGAVRIGSLFRLAQQHGYKPPPRPNGAAKAGDSGFITTGGNHANPPHSASTPTGRKPPIQPNESDAERHRRGAEAAARLWASGSDTGACAYLQRKGIGAHGVRFTKAGDLLVPMRDAAGELVSLQTIRGAAPKVNLDDSSRFTHGDAPAKLYTRGARKSGTWHQLGELAGAERLLIAEGYATAATLHEATALPVACAFDAGNLAHVARALRKLHPKARLAIAGDDDRDTAARTGRNPGREKAEAAARAVRGVAIFPEGLAPGASDFNDLQASAGAEALAGLPEAERAGFDARAAGLEAVRAQVEAALQAAQASKAGPTLDHAEKIDPAPDTQADRFRIDEAGVWFDPPDTGDGGASSPIRICARLRALALARDAHDGSGALLLEFDGHFGTGRRWLMPLAMLAGDGTALRAELLALGFVAPVDSRRRQLLMQYLQSRRPKARVRLTDKTGWHGRRFVLPRETLGDDPDDRLMFQSEAPIESPFAQRGTLADWQQRIGRLCAGNTRLTFSVCVAFAGPVLALSGIADGGGFHLPGESSAGKTTLLRVGASVNGGPDYKGQWRATSNGLESLAAAHSDCVLILDELAQLDPREAGESAYLLANGVGKQRAGRTGAARPRLTWRLLVLSAGEIDLAAHMDEAGKRMRAGQELRLVSVPADAGASLGVFEELHEFESPGDLAQHLARAAERTHGTPGRAWLEYLTEHFDDASRELRERIDAIALQIVPEASSSQVLRVGRRFALIGAAGELATVASLTGWREGEATHAARRCFNAWLESRPGGIGLSEETSMLRQVRGWLAAHGDARFVDWDRGDDDHAPRTMHRAGWRRRRTITGLRDANGDVVSASADEWFISVDTFRSEVCKGFSDRAALRLLKSLGHLHTEGKGMTCSASPPGAHRAQVVRIKASILQGADE